tara:strand:+ start:146 stop:1081 length:936 start_codon:yes stop_codon:yes gene_type:complete
MKNNSFDVTSKHFNVTKTESGQRLDKFISDKLPEISRNQVQKFIDGQQISINGIFPKSSQIISCNDQIELKIQKTSSEDFILPLNLKLNIIYEDNQILAICKPHGLVVHPAKGHRNDTLINAIVNYLPSTKNLSPQKRNGIVHRLDKDTSGIIIIAKTDFAHSHLSYQFKSRQVIKKYTGLIHGVPKSRKAVISGKISRHPKSRQKMAITENGKPAETSFEIIEEIKNYSLLNIEPKTGRTHQIRVHLSSIGHPIVGDSTYGKSNQYINRHFLHASSIIIKHPESNKNINLECELPPDLKDFLKTLKEQQI